MGSQQMTDGRGKKDTHPQGGQFWAIPSPVLPWDEAEVDHSQEYTLQLTPFPCLES